MKGTLLILAPALALFLMACPQKHATTAVSPPPGQPNPNGYNTAPQGTSAPQSGTQPGYDGGGTVINAGGSASSNNNSSGSNSGSNSSSTGNNNSSTVTNGNQATGTTTVTVTNPTAGTADSATHVVGKPDSSSAKTRLVVSFTSIGAGIDMATEANFRKWLSKHPDVTYSVNPWGREGERDYCFELKNKRSESQVEFIKEVRKFFGTNDRVNIQENVVCEHKHTNAEVNGESIAPVVDAPKIDSSNIARVVVSFISRGEGIDLKTKDKLEQWLNERGGVVWETKTFGREGETNYCFFMAGKTTREQEIFVRDLRTFLGENELVLVQEWGVCDKRK